jgi:hypothetical protein
LGPFYLAQAFHGFRDLQPIKLFKIEIAGQAALRADLPGIVDDG